MIIVTPTSTMGLARIALVLTLASCASSAPSLRRRTQAGETLELITPVASAPVSAAPAAAAPAAAAPVALAKVVENGETLTLIDEDKPVMTSPVAAAATMSVSSGGREGRRC